MVLLETIRHTEVNEAHLVPLENGVENYGPQSLALPMLHHVHPEDSDVCVNSVEGNCEFFSKKVQEDDEQEVQGPLRQNEYNIFVGSEYMQKWKNSICLQILQPGTVMNAWDRKGLLSL